VWTLRCGETFVSDGIRNLDLSSRSLFSASTELSWPLLYICYICVREFSNKNTYLFVRVLFYQLATLKASLLKFKEKNPEIAKAIF
jgi:hypothetical protein